MTRLFVVGSFVVGLTMRVPRMPVAGENLIGDSFDLGPGGKGTNQAIASARQGADVRLLACTGDDLFAGLAMSLYQQEGIDTHHIHQVPGSHTGVGFVTLLPEGENWITVDLGANLQMTPAHVAAAEDDLAASDWVICQLEIPLETLAFALDLAHRHGKKTLLNPGPGRYVPPEMLRQIDLLTPNESETRLLLGLRPDDPTPTLDLAHRLAGLGIGQVIVTRGKRGALIVTTTGSEEVPAPTIQAIDPTGAGDSFNATLAVGLGEGLPLRQAVQRACFAGAYTATRLGVINGLPHRAELDAFIAQHHQEGLYDL